MSFGSGFAQGMYAGSAVAQRGMDNYEKRQDEELKGQLFGAAMGLDQEGAAVEDAENTRSNVLSMIENASVGDITNAIVGNYKANGGKINDKTYEMAFQMAGTLFGAKEKEVEFQQGKELFNQKKRLFEKQMQNYDSLISHRGKSGGGGYYDEDGNYVGGGYGGKPTSLMKNYDYIKRTKGQEAADRYMKAQSGGLAADEKAEQPSFKDIESATEALINNVEGFDQLPKQEQYRQATLFAKDRSQMPEVETYEEPSTGFFGSLFGSKDTKYRVKGSNPEAKKEDNKEKPKPKNKGGWANYDY